MRHCISLSILLFASAVTLAETEVPGWGGPIANDKGIEALGWVLGFGSQSDKIYQYFAAVSPARPTTPEGLISSDMLGSRLSSGGPVSTFTVRAYTDKIPTTTTGPATTPANGTASVDVTIQNMNAAPNYIRHRDPTGVQLSPVGAHLHNCFAGALASPGKPVKFVTSCSDNGSYYFSSDGSDSPNYISSYGSKVADISATAVNTALRIPEDLTKPAIATVYINEQITTDIHGNPTTDEYGRYKFDPTATSGYVNIVRIVSSAYSNTPGNVLTLDHAAVIRDPALTDK
ncbi:hypothetical protein DFQ27_003747 [Actinomortierella ambigua]|uniref:Uncharacterized protein n=1 Tax=Actinomortierella ambigua TaxID=1343610 RepID=A0A9P6U4C8_9FUNG|nr:hypothetical protein DFQ27_003747 [Actinomortierella ambigua]